MLHLFSTAATTIETMLIKLNTHPFLAEATSVAAVMPCRYSIDETRRPGDVVALAGRYAR
jgi:hypothetical protein